MAGSVIVKSQVKEERNKVLMSCFLMCLPKLEFSPNHFLGGRCAIQSDSCKTVTPSRAYCKAEILIRFFRVSALCPFVFSTLFYFVSLLLKGGSSAEDCHTPAGEVCTLAGICQHGYATDDQRSFELTTSRHSAGLSYGVYLQIQVGA